MYHIGSGTHFMQPLLPCLTYGEIYRSPVIGVDKRKVPTFTALIAVRDAGACKFQYHFGERVHDGQVHKFRMKRAKMFKKWGAGLKYTADETHYRLLIRLIRGGPVRMSLGFTHRFDKVGLQAFPVGFKRLTGHRKGTP